MGYADQCLSNVLALLVATVNHLESMAEGDHWGLTLGQH